MSLELANAVDWQPGFWDIAKDEYYLHRDFLSASTLEDFRENREMFFAKHIDRTYVPEKKSYFEFGNAFHIAILEPHLFDENVVVSPKFDRRTSKGKEAEAEFLASHLNKTVIDADDHSLIVRMRDAVYSDPVAADLLSTPRRTEQPARWINEETGVWCRCMYDGFLLDGTVLDLKSSSCGTPRTWAKDAGLYGYHRRQAWYEDGRAAIGMEGDFLFVVVSKEEFPRAFVARLDSDDVELGRRQNLDDLVAFQACVEMERWVSVSPGIVDVKIPYFALE